MLATPNHGKKAAETPQCQNKNNMEHVRIGAVHGIPASRGQGLQKIERSEYFRHLHHVCSTKSHPSMDILMTHANPCLPGQEDKVRGEDARHILECFQRSSAHLLVHGHMHTEPAVSVLDNGKVVVNADCRVVAFLPA